MDEHQKFIKTDIYDKCGLKLSDFESEIEGQVYGACQYKLNGLNIVSRNAKITPTKTGQFVTFWKRNGNGPIAPFREADQIDFFVVNVEADNRLGQFVFPKSILIEKDVISTNKKEGKRAFRVYPLWDVAKSKQAQQTQKWQLNYFHEIGEIIDFKKISKLYNQN